MKCRSCDKTIIKFFSLGKMPLVNSFLKKSQLSREKKYDLSVGFCKNCYLVQLMKTISPDELFSDYVYFSSTSSFFVDHCKNTANHLTKKLHLTKKSFIVEIASNDGIQLKFFKNLGMRILGIDPAKNIAKVANANGIPTLAKFFNLKFSKLLVKKYPKADLIFGANVLAHVPEIIDFAQGVKVILNNNGTACFEFPYLDGLFENKFDTIYHEHVFYYSLIALQNIFSKADLVIYDVEFTKAQGNSLRIFICHPGSFSVSARVKNLSKDEINKGFNKLKKYRQIKTNVDKLKLNLISKLIKLKKSGKTIAGYSAPAKGNILLNYFKINNNLLDFIVDKAKSKQGLYTPGTHMLVYPPDKIYQQKPDYVLILCWNIADEVIKQLDKYHRKGGKFIIAIPKLRIV